MNNHKVIFEKYLKSQNLKLTEQRLIVLNAVFAIHEHFSVESLYDYLKNNSDEKYNDVSIPTIYRTLPLLINSGLIKSSGIINERENYEHIYGHPRHIHIVCKQCNKIIEEEDTKSLFKQIKKISDKYEFSVDDFNLSIKGVCNECKQKR